VDVRREIADIPQFHTDRYKLLQIVVNFIGNACDAIAANALGERQMVVRARMVDSELEIAVEDSGVGIPSEFLTRVWEFGFTTKAHGHGFGLHSSAVAAQQLGGTVGVVSAGSGLGACFTVRIPLKVATHRERETLARSQVSVG
jgi:two-component system, NtrC family, sensor kinase